MIMNYVLSFCKITAASRIFSRNFYLPLLKPLTPKDALRTFKITGKWLLGSKIQHYIPVLYNHKKKRSKRAKNYGRIVHKVNDSYTYMSPALDPDNENHKLVQEILNGKHTDGGFVYTVDDKMCNIVMSGNFELAIRDGDIVDVLVSQSDDKILIKLKNFKKIPIPLAFYDCDDGKQCVLYKGEGATTEEEEKFHHHGKMTMSLAKIFEAKELAEEWELEMMKIVAKKKKQRGEGTKEWNEMVSECIQNLDWQKFEVDAKKVIDQIWEPAREEHIGMIVDNFEQTRNVPEFLLKQGNALLAQLPTMAEIPEVVKCMATATYEEIEDCDDPERKISGVRVTLSSGKECFISGQMVKADEGEVFVPGQTIENDFGVSYAPGMTILMDGKPILIKGLIMGEENSDKPMFLPTESTITSTGELTFCRNPEEKVNTKPQKIFIKKRTKNTNGAKKKKKKTAATEGDEQVKINIPLIEETKLEFVEEVEELIDERPEEIEIENNVLIEESIALEVVVVVEKCDDDSNSAKSSEDLLEEDIDKKSESDNYKFDDGMDKLIENLEDKKSELEKKLEELRKLKVTLANSVTYVQDNDGEDAAMLFNPANEEQQHKLADILMTLTRRSYIFRERNDVNKLNIHRDLINEQSSLISEADEKFNACSSELKVALKSVIYAANEVFKKQPKNQQLALHTIAELLHKECDKNKVVDELIALMNTKLDRDEVCTAIFKVLTSTISENKRELLQQCLVVEHDEALDKFGEILEANVLSGAFKKLAKNNSGIVRQVIEHVGMKIDAVDTEQGAKETLHDGIVASTKLFVIEALEEFDGTADDYEIGEFLGEAQSLANILGMYEIEDELRDMAQTASLECATRTSMEFVKRFTLIKKLCERDFSVKASLQRIKKNPECGRSDPRIRQLLMESALLTTQNRKIRNSCEIPLRLFQEQNFLAIEDCVWQRGGRAEHPIVISRKGIQAVVPKEAARNVLGGRVPYMLIDESGVTNFKPMHMFQALKLGNKARERKLSDYSIMGGRETRVSPQHDVSDMHLQRKPSLNECRMSA